jgi:hypothetical protein
MAHMTRQTTQRLGELLLEEKLVTITQLQQALKRQYTTGELLGEALVKLKVVTEADIVRVLCRQFGCPYLNAAKYNISPAALNLIPVDVAIECQIVPLDKIGNVLLLACAGLVGAEVLEAIARRTKLQIFLCISTSSQILEAVKKNGSRLLDAIRSNFEAKAERSSSRFPSAAGPETKVAATKYPKRFSHENHEEHEERKDHEDNDN